MLQNTLVRCGDVVVQQQLRCLPWRKDAKGPGTMPSRPGALAAEALLSHPAPERAMEGLLGMHCVHLSRWARKQQFYTYRTYLDPKASRAPFIAIINDCDTQGKKTNENPCPFTSQYGKILRRLTYHSLASGDLPSHRLGKVISN